MGGGWGPSQGTTFEVTATVDDTFGVLRAGMNVEIQITAQERHDVIAVPIDALKRNEMGEYYVGVIEGGRAFKRPVTPGLRAEGQVEIDWNSSYYSLTVDVVEGAKVNDVIEEAKYLMS